MTDYDFEETYMSLTKKELVKILKRKMNETLKYQDMWKESERENDSLKELLDDYNERLENMK